MATAATDPLFVDRRTGSVELVPGLKRHGIRVVTTTLDFGDFAFMGRGPHREPVAVGIERKTVNDLLSSFTSGRLSGHQLPGLCASYGYVWLLIEGLYRPEPDTGIMQQWRGGRWQDAGHGRNRLLYSALDHYVTTLETHAAVRVRRTGSESESCQVIVDLYRWWVNKAFDDHKSHLALDTLDARDANLMVRPSVVRNIAAQLPGVGWTKSEAVSRHFRTVANMVVANEKEWGKIAGIGSTLAKRIVEALSK